MEVMYIRGTNQRVLVHSVCFDSMMALYYNPSLAEKQCGNGWGKIKIGQLVPEEMYIPPEKAYRSKTERNKIKSMLKLSYAMWECTDRARYDNLDGAIDHQAEIIKNMEEESNGNS